MATEPTSSTQPQPKINHKRSVRTLFYVLILGAAFYGVRWYVNNKNDPTGGGTADTVGMVAAIQYLDDGQQMVAFDANGKKIVPEGYRKGAIERDAAWQPDGNNLFYVSDTKGPGFQVYRWRPRDGSEPEVRSIGTLGKSQPSFPAQDVPHANESMLIVSGGYVLELDPKESKTHQILPPLPSGEVPQENSAEGGGQVTQFTTLYNSIGDSFRSASWCFGKSAVVAVMRRDRGEALVVQPLPTGNEPLAQPNVLLIADRIDYDVSPTDGSVIFSGLGVQLGSDELRALKAAGQQAQRVKHVLGFFSAADHKTHYITRSPDDKIAFSSPKINPAGDRVIAVFGTFDPSSGALDAQSLLSFPFQEDAAQMRSMLVNGKVGDPSWSPDGSKIAYIKASPAGKRAIFVMNADGSGEKSITNDTGDFARPLFSPQKAAH